MKIPIHFTHANGLPGKTYEKFLSFFADEYDVKYIPYIGMNEKFPVTPKWTHLVEEVIEDIETKFPNQKVIGLGHSFGSLVTLMSAYKRPDLFSQIIIMDPPFVIGGKSPIFEVIQKLNVSLVDKATPSGITLKRRDHWESKDEAYESLRNNRLFKAFDDQAFNDYMESGIQDDLNRGGVTLTIPKLLEAEIFRTVPGWWWRTPRKAPNVPTHLITSEHSYFYKQGLPQGIYKHYQIKYTVVDGTHMFPLELPEQTAYVVKEIIKMQNKKEPI
jgi:pimeloyl-ACP methyl ester carboxylesterase